MIQVHFNLWVGIGSKFSKWISVECIPANGALLKVLNISFVVNEHEQNLDAYLSGDHVSVSRCNSIRATINNVLHDPDDYDKIKEGFRNAGWEETIRD